MPSSNKQAQITILLDRFAERGSRVRSLLDISLGRILEESDNASASDVDEPAVKRIVEWLAAAITNDEEWLSYVDEVGRPNKLFIFETVGQLVKEAEHELALFSSRTDRVRLIDGDEEFFAKLSDEFYLVKLLTPWALDRDGAKLESKIGSGYYDKQLAWPHRAVLSLRDRHGKSHGTLILGNNELESAIGRSGNRLEADLMQMVMKFIIENKYKCFIPSHFTGYVMDIHGSYHSVHALPDGLSVQGDLCLWGVDIKQLPKGLRTTGALNINDTAITTLPDDLIIGGSLIMKNTLVEALPEGIQVQIGIFAAGSQVKDVPANFSHRGTLDLSNTPITNLPEGLDVYALILSGCQLKSLPKRLRVRNHLQVNNELVHCLPSDLYVGEYLSSDGAKFGWVPMSVPSDVLIPLPYNLETTVGEHRRSQLPKMVADKIRRWTEGSLFGLGGVLGGRPTP